MIALDPNDARRLKSALAMLASPSDGERLAAVDAVERLLDKAGLDFSDLAPEPHDAVRLSGRRQPPADYVRGLYRLHQITAHQLLRSGHPWTEWEAAFLQGLAWQVAAPSPSQRDKLRELEAVAERRAA